MHLVVFKYWVNHFLLSERLSVLRITSSIHQCKTIENGRQLHWRIVQRPQILPILQFTVQVRRKSVLDSLVPYWLKLF